MNQTPVSNAANRAGAVTVSSVALEPVDAGYGLGGVADPGGGFNPREFLRIVYKRKWYVIGCCLAGATWGLLQYLLTVPLYTSTTRLQIDPEALKVVDRGNIAPSEGGDAEFLRTHYELILSRGIAERVVSMTRLAEDQEFFKSRPNTLAGVLRQFLSVSTTAPVAVDKLKLEQAAVGRVMASRAIRPVTGSRLVDLSYSDPDPDRAQRIAAAFADAYVASRLDKRFQANAFAKTFLEDQLKQIKLRLEKSERDLLRFEEESQIVVTTEKSSIAENNLAAANSALGAIVGERIKAEQQWQQISEATAATAPQFLNNAVIAGLRERRNALVTEYQEKLETFKPGYPLMVQINQKISEIDRQLANEIRTIKTSHKAAFQAAKQQEDAMKERIEKLRAEVLELQKQMVQHNFLKRESDTNRSLYDSMLQRFKEIDIAGGVGASNVFIIDRALRPGGPSNDATRTLLLFCLLGLGAGLAVAVGLEQFDDTVRSPEDVERACRLPMLGIIPLVADGALEQELTDPSSVVSESYRSLCTALQFSTDSGLPRCLLVTSSGPSEGKSITAITIARHFATLGLKVLLIDADLRKPSLHTKLNRPNESGLSNYLTGSQSPPDVMQRTEIATLAFIATGPLPPNAADLLASPRMASLVTTGLEVFDFILLDGPPIMGFADAPLLSSVANATVLVAAAGQVRGSQLRNSIRRIQQARGTLIGSIVSKFHARSAGYGYGVGYGHGYGYGYGYGYGDNAYSYGQKSITDKSDGNKAA